MDAIKLNKDQLGWFLVGVLIGVIITGLFFLVIRQSRPAPIVITPAPPKPTAAPSSTPEPLTVFINGQVAKPGVFELPIGSILQDAIKASGGYTSEANADGINLALPLSSGMHIYIPALDDDAALPIVSSVTEPDKNETGRVNINVATAAELDQLPGIGPATAQNIIDYRQANGSFEEIEAIMNVSGIGPAKFQQIEELISLE